MRHLQNSLNLPRVRVYEIYCGITMEKLTLLISKKSGLQIQNYPDKF